MTSLFTPGRLIAYLLLGSIPGFLNAQCNDRNISFKAGEKVLYHAYYNWGFIWINAGQVTFEVDQTNYLQQPAYHLKAYGSSYKSYDILFKVRDSFDVLVDTLHLVPFEFHRKTNEGSYTAHHHYIFDRQNNLVKSRISKENKPYVDSVFQWPSCSFDLLSMVYKARNIQFDNYKPGDKIPINMIVDGESHDLYIRYQGREDIKNRDGRRFRCLKFSPLLVEGTIFKSGEGMTVWVTDDDNRIPIIVEAKILIGSVKAIFVGAKGLRHPMSAEIVNP
jgi:hypothetical protein